MTEPVFDNTQALQEGWGIFDVENPTAEWLASYGLWSLDGVQNPDIGVVRFGEDADEAWRFVVGKALEGSEYHRAAIHHLRIVNPLEIGFIAEQVPEVEAVP